MDVRRPRCLELGLFLVVVALPLAFTPFTAGPFADPKIILLVLGTLLVWLGGVPVDRRLAMLAGLWVLITAVASLAGIDPVAGLMPSSTGQGGGLIFTACFAVLLVCGAGLPRALTARARGWLAWTGLVVSVVLLVYRLWPDLLEAVLPRLSLIGATLGNQLFAGAFVAVAIAAVVTGSESSIRRLATLFVLAAAVASIGERSSLILPIVALAVACWRTRQGWRRSAAAVALVLGTFAIWQVIEPHLPGQPPPQSAVEQFGGSATDADRFILWRVTGRAWLDRPLLGWGPGTTLATYLHAGTPDEIEAAGRGWPDAHDLFLETGVTTGLAGVLPIVALLFVAVARALRSPPREAWAVGAAAALGAYSLVEPLNLVLTPLLFLTAGIAAAGIAASRVQPAMLHRGVRMLVTAVLGAGLALSLLAFTAAVYEAHGTRYGEPAALRTALRLQPWRSSARQQLAIQLAVAGRSGDEAAAREALALMADGALDRPWDPDVRIEAARVATLLHDDDAARAWLTQQLERFPGDRSWVADQVNAPAEAAP